MISSVDGSNALSNISPQASENASAAAVKFKKSVSAYGSNTTHKTSEKEVQSGDFGNSKVSSGHDFSKVDNNSTQVVDFPKNASDNSNELSINYGKNSETDDETYYPQDSYDIPTSFAELAAMIGGAGGKVTKDQLNSYLKSLTSGTSGQMANAAELTIVKNLIAQFDDLSGGAGFIKSSADLSEAQDYETVTVEQVTPPVDIRV